MAQTIKLKRSATQNAVPSTSQLELGEVALNTYDGKMYIKKSVGGTESIVEIGGDATSSSGLDFTGNLNLEDNVRIVIGDGNDLQIYHDGTDSIINENGTGDLKVFSSRFRVLSNSGEEMIQALENGVVRLYHNNSQRLSTSSSGITVNDAIKIGAASPKIFFSESDTTNLNTRLRSNSGSFQIQTVDNSDANPVTRLGIDNSTGDLRLYDDTGAAAKFHWDASAESLGIGTTSPATNLEISGSAPKLRITDTRDQSFTVGDIMSSIEFDSDDASGGAGSSSEPRAAINMYAASTFGSSTGLSFHTKSDITGYPTKQMVITNLGRVGIGTDSPVQKLDVDDGFIRVQSPDVGGVAPPVLTIGQINNAYQAGITSSIHVSMKAANSAGNFYWYPNSNNPIMILTQAGNLGIGSTSPSEKLQVTGTIKQTGTYNLTLSDGANITGSNHVYIKANSSYVRLDAPSNSIYYNAGTDHVFRNGDGSTEYMRIDTNGTNAGNVGIGISAPSTPLAVQSNSSAQGIDIFGRSSDDISQLDFSENDGTLIGGFQARTTDFRIRSVQNLPLLFMTNNTERVRINSNGQLGIGVTNFTNAQRGNGKQLIIGNCFVGTGAALVVDDFSRFAGPIYIHQDSSTNSANVTALDNNGNRLVITGKGGTTNNALDAPDGFYVGGTQFITSSRQITNVTSITATGAISTTGTASLGAINVGSSTSGNVFFKRPNANYIFADQSGGYLVFGTNGRSTSVANSNFYLGTNQDVNFQGSISIASNVTSSGLFTSSQNQQGFRHIAPDVMSGHTSRNEMTFSWTGDETRWYMFPTVDGSGNFNRELSFDYSSEEWSVEGPFTAGELTTTGYLRGPSTFTIDPATHGDDTGTVVIAGNLQVDGTTTTINSTTLNVDDKNITLASGSTNKAAANGAGITVDCGSDTDATFTYNGTSDQWELNKILKWDYALATTALHLNNNNIVGVNNISFADPGGNEGLQWSNIRIFESPNDLSNTSGNFQVTYGGTRRLTVDNTGIEVNGSIFATPVSYAANQDGFLLKAGASNSANWDGMGFKLKADGSGVPYITVKGSVSLTTMTWKSGSVGVGTEAPTERLHVRGGDLAIDAAGASNTASLKFINDNERSRITSNYGSGGGGQLGFWTDTTGGTLVQRMTITNAGNVGIGTTAPSATLHVKSTGNGEINIERASGALINLQAQASAAYIGTNSNHQFGLKANGSVRLKIATNGAISFNDAFTFPTSDGSGNQVLRTDGSGNVSWATVQGVGAPTYMEDADGDTKIQVEESSDEDIIRFDTAGTERARIGVDASSDSTLEIVRSGVPAASGKITFNGSGLITDATSGYHGLIVRTGGTERLRVKDTGDVGIGTTSPYNKLQVVGNARIQGNLMAGGASATNVPARPIHVKSAGDAAAIRIEDTTSSNTVFDFRVTHGEGLRFINVTGGITPLFVGTDGNVGIGTTDPSAPLHLKGTGDTTLIVEADSDNSGETDNARIELRQDGNNVAGYLYTEGNAGQTATGTLANTTVLESKAAGNDVGIHFATGGKAPSQSGGPTNGTVRMTVLGNGNVGIGTSSPGSTLDVQGNTNLGSDYIGNQYTTTLSGFSVSDGNNFYGSYGTLLLNSNQNYTSSSRPYMITNALGANKFAIISGTDATTDPTIGTAGNITSGSARLVIDNAGNVGIGTASPGARLHVDGTWTTNRGTISVNGPANGLTGVGITSNNNYRGGLIHRDGTAGQSLELTAYSSESLLLKTTNTTRLAITSGGNVGIGTTSPDQKLSIKGRVSSDLADSYYGAWFEGNSATNGYSFFSVGPWYNGAGYFQRKQGQSYSHIYEYNANHNIIIQAGSGANGETAGGGKVGIGTTSPQAKLQVEELGIDTTTTATSATTQVAIDTMAAATFRSAEFTIQVTNSTDSTYHLTKVLLIHDGTTPGITEYGTVFTGSAAEATFDADISSGNVRLLATPASTDSMTFKVVRHCITV